MRAHLSKRADRRETGNMNFEFGNERLRNSLYTPQIGEKGVITQNTHHLVVCNGKLEIVEVQ